MGRAAAVFWIGAATACGRDGPCDGEAFTHQGQSVLRCDCGAEADAIACCVDHGGHGGVDLTGAEVPAGRISAEAAICIAASNGMEAGLSPYLAVWDPNRSGDELWSVEMIQDEDCLAEDWAEGQADYWQIDGATGEILSQGVEYYSAVVCSYD